MNRYIAFEEKGTVHFVKNDLGKWVRFEDIEAQQQEIEQLKAQAAAMREILETLEFCRERFPAVSQFCPVCGTVESEGHTDDCELSRLIYGEPVDYHNPADTAEIDRLSKKVDTQAERIMRMDTALKTTVAALTREGICPVVACGGGDCENCWNNYLLGGAEDEPK
ncbi:MAG: hypothetical protein N2513_10510 [Deltaproteobacteria bacterium]|nr:hypothetical protein [Deltaproteobacteria bacterium]